MKRSTVIIACTAALANCNKPPQVHEKNASIEQVANAVSTSGVANDLYLKAGEWKVTAAVDEMDIPGLPPEAQSQMKQAMSQRGNTSYQYCLTAEQAKKPGGKFFNRQADRNCRYDHFSMGDGKIDAVLRCAAPAGSMSMAIDGTYSADSYSTHVSMNMEGGQKMTMKMRSEAHRIGECNPEDEARANAESGTKG
ncbi:MAG TPA: DUF3617 domain-containing protein [Sphingomicrobium sp.]|jgi:hypothetical protein|nr:DUF3617 domain-containing protein [Sphingomicrobium sp.]